MFRLWCPGACKHTLHSVNAYGFLLQPGGAGVSFYVGTARCRVCRGQVCSLVHMRQPAVHAAAALPCLGPHAVLSTNASAALQGVLPCPLCAGYEGKMPAPNPDRPAVDFDAPEQLPEDDEDDGDYASWRRFGKVDIERAGHGW